MRQCEGAFPDMPQHTKEQLEVGHYHGGRITPEEFGTEQG